MIAMIAPWQNKLLKLTADHLVGFARFRGHGGNGRRGDPLSEIIQRGEDVPIEITGAPFLDISFQPQINDEIWRLRMGSLSRTVAQEGARKR